jgi:hypothetical protein
MRSFLTGTVWLVAVLVLAPAQGQMPLDGASLVKTPDCLRSPACCSWCPNDYQRKPLPCIPLPPCLGCANDYLRKPLPCVPPPVCGGPNDYCRKPLVFVRPNCEPWYSCVPGCQPATPKAQSAAPKELPANAK